MTRRSFSNSMTFPVFQVYGCVMSINPVIEHTLDITYVVHTADINHGLRISCFQNINSIKQAPGAGPSSRR